MKFSSLFKISPVGVLGTLIAGMTSASFNSMGPIFAASIGLTITQISTFMASILLGGMLLQFPVGRLSDRFDRRGTLIVSALLTSLAAAGIIWASDQSSVIILFAIGAIYGGFCYTVYPLSSAQVNDMADQDHLVQVSAGLLLAYGTGASIGPIIASQIMGVMGPAGLFYFIAACAVFLALFALLRIIQRPSGEHKASFLPLGSIGTSSKQLYSSVQASQNKRSAKS